MAAQAGGRAASASDATGYANHHERGNMETTMMRRFAIGALGIALATSGPTSAQSGEQRVVCYGNQGGRTTITLNAARTYATWRGLGGSNFSAAGGVSTRRSGSQFFFGSFTLPNGEVASMALELGFDGRISGFTYSYFAFGRDREITGDCEPE